MMNRLMTSAARKALKRENASWPRHLVRVPRDQWPPQQLYGAQLLAVWRSRTLLVQVYRERNSFIRVTVNRTELLPNGRWRDDLTWDELQGVKDTIGFADHDAVEVYPRADDVVNVANMRHLWIMPAPLEFAWRSKE